MATDVVSAVRLRPRHDLHLLRKAWHLGMGLLMVGIYQHSMSREMAVTVLGSVLAGFLMIESARLRIPALNAVSMRVWGPLMRKGEETRMSGLPYYVGATLLAIAIFPKPVAVLCVMFLAIGDPLASLVGILYGDRGPRFASGKSLIGTAAGVAACITVALLFLNGLSMDVLTWLTVSVIGGFVGGTVELLPFEVDDNFSIPVVSGFVLWLLFLLAGV
ncbi:MAG: hypothetical protein IT285_08460 [Bdellovibrionales bacterium]|nr:hypothetical protein [Bdellovibrionales bacterium]